MSSTRLSRQRNCPGRTRCSSGNPGERTDLLEHLAVQEIGVADEGPLLVIEAPVRGADELRERQELTQTMGATRQLKLARAATVAHFEAVLRNDVIAAAFSTTDLGTLVDVDVSNKQ